MQLIDAATDEHLWAEIYDRELTAVNAFAVQSEITEKIADALQAELSTDEQLHIEARPTRVTTMALDVDGFDRNKFVWYFWSSNMAPFRQGPRFAALVTEMNMLDY